MKKTLMPQRVKRAKVRLEKLSHDHVRRRDSLSPEEIRGNCFDCGVFCEGQQFQAGHWQPSGSCGALLRYHPHNMHGQAGGCNMKQVQERVKINYTMKMVDKYGREYVEQLRQLRNKSIKADIIFYDRMIELYEEGDEEKIVDYLHSL